MSKSSTIDDFGAELRELSEAELERRANESVEQFYKQSQSHTEATEADLSQEVATPNDIPQNDTEDSEPRSTEPLGTSRGNSRDECKNGNGDSTELSCPWRGEQYEQDKTKFGRIVARNRKGGYPTRLSEVVKSVYSEDYTNTEYNRLSRFAERCSWFQIDRGDGFVEVEPEPICFKAESLLSPSYEYPQKTGRNGDGQSTVTSSETTGDSGLFKSPKERVQSYLESHKTVQSDNVKRDLFREFVTWRKAIEGTYTYLKQYRDRANTEYQYLMLEQPSRFKDRSEASKSRNRLNTALDKARESYNRGVMVTLTPDPKRFEGNAEILEAIQDSLSNFIERSVHQLGERPDYVKVLEFQQNGLPHYHVALFGVRVVDDGESETGEPTISEQEVQEYWDEKKRIGKEVDVRPIHVRSESWLLHEDKDGKISLSYYLGDSMRGLSQLAETDVSELQDMVESDDVSLWRQVLYWAYEKQYLSCSNSLKESNSENHRSNIKQWEYVGTAEYKQIPLHVRHNAFLAKYPPP